jgi:hypothetical protein
MKSAANLHRTIAFVLLLFATDMTSFAQGSHVAVLLNSVNSSLNYGEMNSSLRKYKKDVRGIQAGLSWQASITERFSIVTESYFVKKGGTLKAGNPLTGEKSSLKLYTAELPVLARLYAGRFYFNAGPYANYIFSGKRSEEGEGSHSISFGDQPDAFRRWETGLQGGAGYQFTLKKARMAVDLRYTHGLTSISKANDLYNRTINLNLLVLRSRKSQG